MGFGSIAIDTRPAAVGIREFYFSPAFLHPAGCRGVSS
jgi:hypothetical protein